MQPGIDNFSPEAVTQAAARTLLCCNSMMMKQRAEINRLQEATKSETSRKRSAEEDTNVAEETVVAASAEQTKTEEKAVELSKLTPLQRAIAAEFVM